MTISNALDHHRGRTTLDGSIRSKAVAVHMHQEWTGSRRKSAILMFLMACAVVCTGALSQAVYATATSGWSEFVPSPDSRIVYVSQSEGSNSNDGLSPNSPVQSISVGVGKLRNGYPDWLLLKRGDQWNEQFSESGGNWSKSGRSMTEPIRIGAYGSSPHRPKLVTSGTAFVCHTGSHIAITGIHFQSQNGGNEGFRIVQGYGQNWLIEDCKIEGYQNNFNVQGFGTPGEIHNVRIRRCVVVDAASVGGGHSQGIYTSNVHGLLLEENVFDHNGWSQNNNAGAPGFPTVFNHNMYIATSNTDVEVRGNIISDASSHGLQLRCGGVIEENLFVRNPLSILLGGGDPDPDTHTYGITGSIENNVVLDGRDISTSLARGFGIDLSNVASATVINNIVANQTMGSQPRPFTLLASGYGSGVGVNNVVARDNIVYNWGGSVQFVGTSSTMSGIQFLDNDIQNLNNAQVIVHNNSSSLSGITSGGNRCSTNASNGSWCTVASTNHSWSNWMSLIGDTTSSAQAVSYPAPSRSVASYNASLGGSASHSAFMTEARKQSRTNWRPEYTAAAVNDYIRAGFGVQ